MASWGVLPQSNSRLILSLITRFIQGAGPARRLFLWTTPSRYVFSAVIVWLVLSASALAANNLISEQAWFEDASASLGFDEARASDQYQVYEGLLNKGYGTGALWVRLTIDPAQASSHEAALGEAILRMQPAYLDEVAIFDPRFGVEPVAFLGDRHHPKEAERLSLTFDHALALSGEPFDLYLRLTSTSTRQLHAQVLEKDAFRRTELVSELGTVFYTVALLVMLLVALIQWRLSADSIFGYFSLSVLTAFAYAWSVTGLIRVIWPADWPVVWMDGYQSFFSITATAAGILFHVMFLARFGLPRWAWALAALLLANQLVQYGLLFSGQVILALELNLLDVLIAPIFFLVLAIVSGRRHTTPDPLPHIWVVSLYALLLAFMLIAALPGLGWVKGPEFSLYIVQVNALASGLLILLLLQYRQRLINQQSIQFEKQAFEAEQSAERARFARAEQQKLLDMLTHELKVPLAVMRMQIDETDPARGPLSRAIQDMSMMIERCAEAARAEDEGLVPVQVDSDLYAIIDQGVASVIGDQKIDWRRPDGSYLIETDPQLMLVILLNLLENACKYSPKDATVRVWVEDSAPTLSNRDPVDHKAATWSVCVANEPGDAGWPDASQLFQKYYRSSQARRQSGTGLGLFLAQSLATLLGQRIVYAPDDTRVVFKVMPISN